MGDSLLTIQYTWDYDNAGRLVSESLTRHDLLGYYQGATNNEADYVDSFEYDLVGNRLSFRHIADGVSDDSFTTTYQYDANDRLDWEQRVADSNTTNHHFIEYTYDGTQQSLKEHYKFQTDDTGNPDEVTTYSYNSQGRLSKVEIDDDGNGSIDKTSEYDYNDSGIRVAQTIDSSKTVYVIDENNHTDYAQVLEELAATTGALLKSYLLGHDVLSQYDQANDLLHLLSDGHGSTRQLVDALGAPLSGELYTYNAYGELLFFTGTPVTTLLYSGEQTDSTGLQYLRARYYDPATGQFNRLDPFVGNIYDAQSLHKYLYTHDDPINGIDPTGLFRHLFGTTAFGIEAEKVIVNIYKKDHFGHDTSRSGRATRIGERPSLATLGSLYYAKPDILNKTTKKYGEVKPLSPSGVASGVAQLALREFQFNGTGYSLDTTWVPSVHTGKVFGQPIVFVNVDGLIFYSNLEDLGEDIIAISTITLAKRFAAKYTLQSAFAGARALAGARVAVGHVRLESHVSIGALIASFGVI